MERVNSAAKMKTRTIAIIGAGFCGSTLAVHLLRQPPANPVRVLLISRPGNLARGVAYSTDARAHVLNVPAGRMNALTGEGDSFLEYVRRTNPTATAGAFVERRIYGDYLEALLQDASRGTSPGCELHQVTGEVVKLLPDEHTDGAVLLMDNGEHYHADSVVLSIGSCARQDPWIAPQYRSFYASPRYVHDPWQPGALDNIGADEPVVLIGSGLTMLDVVLDLRDRGHTGPLQAVSRRGLLPQPHRELSEHPAYDKSLSEHMLTDCRVRHYVRAVRDAIRLNAHTGGDWRDIIGGLRSNTAQLWHALPLDERKRFLRHVRPYWDAHRHRCAPKPGARLQAELASGTLNVLAGRIVSYTPAAESVCISLTRRGENALSQLNAAAVINCTTPALDIRQLNDPLLLSLRTDGLLRPDALGTGLDIAASGALMGSNGAASSWLYYVGPFLQGRDWEATAVPELREYVKHLADTLSAALARQ